MPSQTPTQTAPQILPQTLPQVKSPALASLLARYKTVRAATLAFVAPLSPEDMMVQSCPEASPVKWHLAHTSWFFETFILTPYAPNYQPFHPDFHWLFNSYYTSLGDMPAKNLRSSFSRPPLADILAYRQHVDQAIASLLSAPLLSFRSEAEESLFASNQQDILTRLTLGLEHEQQHLELIATDIKHALFTNPLKPAYATSSASPDPSSPSPAASFTSFPGGLTQIGLTPDPTDPRDFAFDNETPRHTVYLEPFQIANRLVTVREYLAFLDDNGYTRPELWLSEGWSTMRAEAWQAPLYWTRDSQAPSGWSIFTLHGTQPLDALLDTPVCHLSLFEADAYARWSGFRLPTEFEWEQAAASLTTMPKGESLVSFRSEAEESAVRTNTVPLSSHSHRDGWELQTSKGSVTTANMLETAALHPTPAAPISTLQQIFGDAWEWTSSGYTGYPGYKPLPGALGEYNGKFMSSQVILRGGSAVTPASHIRATYRNFFPPATRWQFSGLRLAK